MIENARLVERDLRRLNELSLLTQIALATITAPDLDELLNIAVEALQQPLGYAIVGVGLLDESGNWITMHPSYRGPEGLLPLPALRGLAGAAIQSGKPVRVDDVRSDARYHMSTATTRSELAVPLKVGERVIGIINTESTWVAAYTEADEQLLTVVASLLAPIIDNARLRARAEQHARELDLLFRAQSAASASLDLGAVLTAIAEQISRALDGTSAYVCELDESGGTTVVAEWYGPAALAQERVSDLNVHYGPEMSQTAVMAIRAGRPLVTGPDDPLSTETERQRRRTFGARSMLIVPLMRQGRALGYVEVWDSRQAERVFTAGELRLAQTMAGNAAAALENAQLYLAAQRQAEQMRLINDVGRAIARILDVDSLTGQIGRSLSAAFGFYQSNVGLLDGDELVFRSHLDQRRNLMIPEARFPLDGAGIVAWVARTGQPWAAADVTRDPHFVPSPYFPATRSEAAVPLMVRDLVVGVLDVQSEQLGGLGPADLAALQAISGQLAVGIENARLFAEARHRADEVAALLATTLGLSSTLDLPTRLTIIAQHAQRLVGGDASTIYRLDDAAGCLRPIMATDDNFARDVPAANVMLGQGITGFVAQSGVAEMVNRVDLDPRAVQIPGTPLTPESVIAAPLRVGDRVTGVMAVYKDGLSDFEPHDLELITSFAAQAAVAIENVDLYQALVERAESLQAAFDELSRMDQLKDEMVQNISHELRTPITFLRSYVELLLSGDLGPLQPQQEKSLRVVANKTDTLVRLVNDIITLQAVTPATIQMVLLDLNAVAQTAADGAVAAAREAGVRFTLNLPRDPAHVRGDPLRLSQVFDNLLINAVKFSQVGDEIGLSVQLAQNVVRVEVRDTGVGISSENLNRVFDRFYQIDGTPTRRRGGLGLGLSICKLIVESHGGYMGVDSAVGYGSCFYFVLPLDNGSEAGA
jgi:signal transduction histidine kinase